MKLLRTACYWPLLVIAGLAVSCNSNEIADSKDVNPETVYFDYRVWGDEESAEITLMLQYRFGGPNGTTLVLSPPSQVEFDGEPVNADSSKMTGAYYEVRVPAAGFAGQHSIVFTGPDQQQYTETFESPVFSLATELPAQISRGDLVFELEGVASREYIKVLLTDTSYYSRGIDRVDTVEDGRILIACRQLESLKNGPVHLEFYRDKELPLKEKPGGGGKLFTSYGIKRQFELID